MAWPGPSPGGLSKFGVVLGLPEKGIFLLQLFTESATFAISVPDPLLRGPFAMDYICVGVSK